MERCPFTLAANSLGGRVPRKRVRVSDSWPVILSTWVRSSTPLARPASKAETNQHQHSSDSGGAMCMIRRCNSQQVCLDVIADSGV